MPTLLGQSLPRSEPWSSRSLFPSLLECRRRALQGKERSGNNNTIGIITGKEVDSVENRPSDSEVNLNDRIDL